MKKYIMINPQWKLINYMGIHDRDVPELQRRSRMALRVRNGDQLHVFIDGEEEPPFSCGGTSPVSGAALITGADWANARSSLEEVALATDFDWARNVGGVPVPTNQNSDNFINHILNEFNNEIYLPVYRQTIEEFDVGITFDESCTMASARDILFDRGADGTLLEPTFCLDCDTGVVSLQYMGRGERWFIRRAGREFCVQTSGIAIEVLRDAMMDDGGLRAVFERVRGIVRNDEAGLVAAARHAWSYLGELAQQMPQGPYRDR